MNNNLKRFIRSLTKKKLIALNLKSFKYLEYSKKRINLIYSKLCFGNNIYFLNYSFKTVGIRIKMIVLEHSSFSSAIFKFFSVL